MTTTFDTIILGAGAMGTAAAYYLSARGQRVLLLEQFELDHKQGSSSDYSRIIRYSYANPVYIDLMRAAYPLWHDLERVSGEKLYQQTGGLDIGLMSEPTFRDTLASLQHASIPNEIMDAAEARYRYPMFRFEDEFKIIYQPDTGILAASRAVITHAKLAIANGATFKANTPVTRITAYADSVTVVADETYAAARLVICAGSWTNDMLAHLDLHLPLEPEGIQIVYFDPPQMERFSPPNMPVFITHLNTRFGDWVYGIPNFDDSGLKVAFHSGQRVKHVSQIDYTPKPETIERLRGFIRAYLPDADAPVKSTRICLYTMTPDENFVIDQHPQHQHISIAAGFSGHGFKFSTLVGKMLSDLTLDGETPYNRELFRMERFQ